MAASLKFGNGNWATKEGSTLAYSDKNGNFKPLPFDFTRASNGTRVDKAGLIETVGNGIPRIDFQGNTEGALLLEPQRTNLITYSEDFSNAAWTKLGSTVVTSNYGVSPSGNNNSSLVTFGDKTSANQLYFNVNTSASNYTSSIYLRVSSGTAKFKFGFFDGSFKNTEIIVTSEWQRFSYSQTLSSSSSTRACWIYPDSIDASLNLEIYGAQCEQASYPTSYIKTEGSAVTRLADSCLQGGFQDKNIFGSTQGSAVFEFKWDASNYVFDFNDSSGIRIRIFRSTTSWRIRDFSGASWYFTGFTNLSNVKTKIGFKWNGTEFTAFQDGVKSSSTDSFASSMSIESITTNKLNNTSNMQFYNTALTDAELIALTQV